MGVESILDSTSFSVLDEAGQKAVSDLFKKSYKWGLRLNLAHHQLFKQRKSLPVLLDFYGNKIDQMNPAGFCVLDATQKSALKRDLLFAFYLFSAQYQLDEAEHRRQNLKERSEQIKKCANLLDQLRQSKPLGVKKTPEEQLEEALSASEKHLKYLGLTTVAPYVADKMVCLDEAAEKIVEFKGAGKTAVIKTWMGELNGKRLYWVWAGGLLSSVVNLLPADFANRNQTARAVAAPAPVTGYMSWILYYARFGINLFLLLKHTIAGPWMSEKERKIPIGERFKTQWEQRKFSLLNDSIWATANMVCFLWLVGNGLLGYLGNVLTACLLLMDTCFAAWKFWAESTEHNVTLQRYQRDIKKLMAQIEEQDENEKQRRILLHQLDTVIRAKEQCEKDWKYKKYDLIKELVYAASLFTAFALMCACFLPPAAILPAASIVLGLAGAALCFILTTVYTAIGSAIEISKIKQARDAAEREYESLLQKFVQSDDVFVKKQLYLDMGQLTVESKYLAEQIRFQKIKLVRAVLIDTLVPPLIFISFMFMPLGIGIAVLAAGLALAFLSNYIINCLDPKKGALPDLNEGEYETFERQAKSSQGKGYDKNLGFFSPPKDNGVAKNGEDDDPIPHGTRIQVS